MQGFVTVAWAYVILEGIRFGYTVGWDMYNLYIGVYS